MPTIPWLFLSSRFWHYVFDGHVASSPVQPVPYSLVLLPFLHVLNVLHDFADVPRGRVPMILTLDLVLRMASATCHHLVLLDSKVEVDVVQLVEVSVVHNQLHTVVTTQGALNQGSTESSTDVRNKHNSLRFADHFKSLDFFV